MVYSTTSDGQTTKVALYLHQSIHVVYQNRKEFMNDDTQLASQQLAQKALEESQQKELDAQATPAIQQLSDGDDATDMNLDDELAASDELATTINSLQNVIERNAENLQKIADELKHKRESMKNVFENDTTLAEAQEQAALYNNQLKERKAKLQTDPQVTSLKVQIGELNEQKKEIEEALSNHLVQYYQLTNSKSFDTSDGDQWEFDVRAKVKARKG
jgi:chromosome segregation ATPase